MDITLGNRNDGNGRFNFVIGDDGDVSFDDTEAHAVMTSCLEHYNGYAEDPTHGNKAHLLKSLTERTPSQAEAMTAETLQRLEEDGVISEVVVTATAERERGRLNVDVEWTTPNGVRQRQRVEV